MSQSVVVGLRNVKKIGKGSDPNRVEWNGIFKQMTMPRDKDGDGSAGGGHVRVVVKRCGRLRLGGRVVGIYAKNGVTKEPIKY